VLALLLGMFLLGRFYDIKTGERTSTVTPGTLIRLLEVVEPLGVRGEIKVECRQAGPGRAVGRPTAVMFFRVPRSSVRSIEEKLVSLGWYRGAPTSEIGGQRIYSRAANPPAGIMIGGNTLRVSVAEAKC
jgi:hypothetical protein